jgi:hypothetical protein
VGIYPSSAQHQWMSVNSLFRSNAQQRDEKYYEVYKQQFDDTNNTLLAVQVCVRERLNQGTDVETVTRRLLKTVSQIRLPKIQNADLSCSFKSLDVIRRLECCGGSQ